MCIQTTGNIILERIVIYVNGHLMQPYDKYVHPIHNHVPERTSICEDDHFWLLFHMFFHSTDTDVLLRILIYASAHILLQYHMSEYKKLNQ